MGISDQRDIVVKLADMGLEASAAHHCDPQEVALLAREAINVITRQSRRIAELEEICAQMHRRERQK